MADIKGGKYSGYKSFSYLAPDVDYKYFNPAREVERVESYVLPLSESEEVRVNELNKKCLVIALHDHVLTLPAELSQLAEWSRAGRYETAFEGLYSSCIDAVFDNLWAGLATITSKGGWTFADVVNDLGMRLSDIAHQNYVIRAERVSDIVRAHDEGNVAFIPGIESGAPIEKELDRIDVLYGLGVRMMGITYSESNQLGSGLKENNDGGLTYFGHQAVDRMNKLGMAIDIAHSGDKTSLDTIKASNKPVFNSHSGARGIWNSKRLKPDKVIKACAENGGITGIMASPHLTFSRKHPNMDIEAVMDHFEYCVDLVGIDHVSFGLDTLYGDHVGLHDVLGGGMSMSEVTFDMATNERPTRVAYVKGMENPTEGYNNILRWLVKHRYSDEEIAKLLGGNVLRALDEIWY